MNVKKLKQLSIASALFLGAPAFAIDLPENYIQHSQLMSKELLNAEEIILHIQEANEQKVNPVVLAIQKDDIELAELLLTIRRIEISLGLESFEFPGYSFKRAYGGEGEEAVVWVKKSPITLISEMKMELSFSEAKVDVDLLKLLIKYDEKKLWTSEITHIMRHAYQRCDLEAILFCFQLSASETEIDFGDALSRPRYLVDPFLSEFAIDLKNPTHFYNNTQWPGAIPCIWDFRPDDNVIVREIKKQIQSFAGTNNQPDKYQEQIDKIQNDLSNLVNQMKENMDECKRIFEEHKTEISTLKNEIQNLEAQRKQDTDEYKQKIAELETKLKECKEIEDVLINYGNNPDGLTAFHCAIQQGDLKTVKLLISRGINCNSQDNGITALIRAVRAKRIEIAKLLLENGADANTMVTKECPNDTTVTNFHKYDALFLAAHSGSSEMVNLLISHGAMFDVNYMNCSSLFVTPLHIASAKGNYGAAEQLILLGAPVNAKANSNYNWTFGTPLDFAACILKYDDNPQNLELVRFLVQNGAERCIKTYFGDQGSAVKCPVISGYLRSVNK